MAPTIMPFKGGFSFDFLGPRPAGDPHALVDLANDLRTQAAAVRDLMHQFQKGRSTPQFSCTAGDRFRTNADHSIAAVKAAAGKLDDAATSALADAHKLADAQEDWDRRLNAAYDKAHAQQLADQRAQEARAKAQQKV